MHRCLLRHHKMGLLLQGHFFTPPLTETPVTTPITTPFNQ